MATTTTTTAPEPSSGAEAAVDPVTGEVLETPELRVRGLAEMRRRMAADVTSGRVPRFPRDDDRFLLAFLRARKYNMDASYRVLTNFTEFWFNPKYRPLIEGMHAEGLRAFYRGAPSKILEGRDLQGNGLCTIYAGRMAAEFMGFEDQIRLGVFYLAWLLEHDDVQLRGVTYVETFEGFSFRQALGLRNVLSGAQQKELMSVFLERFPIRIRHIYVIRQPRFFSIVWAVARLFFKKKLTERVHLLGDDLPALHAAVPPGVLPPEFGGTLVEAPDAAVDRLLAAERSPAASLGGFVLPVSVDHAGLPGLPGAGSLAALLAASGAGAGAAGGAPVSAFAGAAGEAGAAGGAHASSSGAPSSGPVSLAHQVPLPVSHGATGSESVGLELGAPVGFDTGVVDLSSVAVLGVS